MKVNRFILAADVLLAMAFAFSCTQNSLGDDNNAGGNNSSNSGSQQYLYCVYPATEACTTGPVTECPSGGAPKDECPAGFSKDGNAPSSSSTGGDGNIYGSFTYEGKTYKTIKIGTQTWMAENLNSGNGCGGNNINDSDYRAKYGMLYRHIDAMSACPDGWHLPTNAEWEALFSSVGGSTTAGIHLRAKDGWNYCGPFSSGNSYLCEDTYGFSALPGGSYFPSYGNRTIGTTGFWWSADEDCEEVFVKIAHDDERATSFCSNSNNCRSVRCIQDYYF